MAIEVAPFALGVFVFREVGVTSCAKCHLLGPRRARHFEVCDELVFAFGGGRDDVNADPPFFGLHFCVFTFLRLASFF